MVDRSRARWLIAILAAVTGPGCTATQLRRYTVHQAATIHDIYQQQVLDNLAMFVHNRNSYPYFALIGQGTSTLTDSATIADTNGWARNAAGALIYATTGVNPSAMRSQMGSWQTWPISDSVKLNVMQCVYQKAVDGCVGTSGNSCPDCGNLFYAYYNMMPPFPSNSIPYHNGPKNDPSDPSNAVYLVRSLPDGAAAGVSTVKTDIAFATPDALKGYTVTLSPDLGTSEYFMIESSYQESPAARAGSAGAGKNTVLSLAAPLKNTHAKRTKILLTLQLRPPIRGVVTPECLDFRSNWFESGKCLPKRFNKCMPYGYYCGTYVWVPEPGIDQLTKLILLIQDIAYYDPPQAGTQTVTTQKTQGGMPGPKSVALRAALDRFEAVPKTDEAMKPMLNDLRSLIDQQDDSTISTTTTVAPPSRQPTIFQPGVLNLQQSLNLLPPQHQ